MLIKNNQRGASAIETTIVLPIVLFLTILCIDFGRYYVTRGVVEAAAQRALTFASVVPALEEEDKDGNNTKFEETTSDILNRVDSLLSHSGIDTGNLGSTNRFDDLPATAENEDQIGKYFEPSCYKRPCLKSVTLRIPKPSGAESLSQLLLKKPIQLDLKLSYNPILPFFGHIDLPVHAVAFREPRNTATLPLIEDCGLGCTCPDNPNMVIGEFGCECPDPLITDPEDSSSCICPGGKVKLPGGGCGCIDCTETWERVPGGCGCRCPANKIVEDNKCVCKAPYKEQGNLCVCNMEEPCPVASLRNSETCQCECIHSNQELCNNNCTVRCPPGQHFDDNCGCACDDPNLFACQEQCVSCLGGRVEPDTCKCLCPNNSKQACDGKCVDCPCGNILGPAPGCACTEEIDPDAVKCVNGACDTGGCYVGVDLTIDPKNPYCGTDMQYACTCPPDQPEMCIASITDFSDICRPECPPNMSRHGLFLGSGGDGPADCVCRCNPGYALCDEKCVPKDCSADTLVGSIPATESCGCECPKDKPRICNSECRQKCGQARNAAGVLIDLQEKPDCNCGCPEGTTMYSRDSYLFCLPGCSDGKIYLPVAGGPDKGFYCGCDPNSTPIDCNHSCVAETCSTQGGRIHDPTTCECRCKDTEVVCDNKCVAKCAKPELTRKDGACGECTCAADEYRCMKNPLGSQCVKRACQFNGETFDESICSCSCGTGGELCDSGVSKSCMPKCPAGMVRTSDCGDCKCPAGQYECGGTSSSGLTGRGACYANCGADQTPDMNNCGVCKCNQGQLCTNKQCKTCQAPFVLDVNSCNCVCPAGKLECSAAQGSPRTCENTWSCGTGSQPSVQICGQCDCSSGYWPCNNSCVRDCPSPKVRDTQACDCKCPVGYQTCGPDNSCIQCRPDQELNLSTCQCECKNPSATACKNECKVISCTGNVGLNLDTCTCTQCAPGHQLCNDGETCKQCNLPYVLNKSTCECECQPGTEEVTCNNQPKTCLAECGNDRVRNLDTCNCDCKTTLTDSQCGPGSAVEFYPPTCKCQCKSGAYQNTQFPNPPPFPQLVCIYPPGSSCLNEQGINTKCYIDDNGTGWEKFE